LLYAAILFIFQISIRAVRISFPDVLGYATSIHVQELLVYTNEEREKAGLDPLVYNDELSLAARRKAEDMFAKNYWAHFGPNGEKPWDFIAAAGYSYTVAGENLAKNFSDSRQVVNAWMASSTHKDNILKASYREIGFAVVDGILQGEETTLVVQFFGNSGEQISPRAVPDRSIISAKNRPVAQLRQVEIGTGGVFSGVTRKPIIDVSRLTRDIAFIFTGILLSVLALDAWLIAKRRTVRVAGHSVAHMMFLGLFIVFAFNNIPGSII